MILSWEELYDKYGFEELQMGKFDGLIDELVSAQKDGRCVQISTSCFGKPTAEEIERKLVSVSFIEADDTISILLDMEQPDTKEIVSTLIPNIHKVEFDHGYPFPHTKKLKYSIACRNTLLDASFIDHRFEERQKPGYFEQYKDDKALKNLQLVKGRLFVCTE